MIDGDHSTMPKVKFILLLCIIRPKIFLHFHSQLMKYFSEDILYIDF